MYLQKLDKILKKVEKPARYIGNELNFVLKDPKSVSIRFAFCFPDVYEVGMSHLGLRILYHLLNEREDTYCERVFAPWHDMEKEMKNESILLYGLESKEPINKFDFVGFTLQYEMSYSNILNMLSLSDIELLSKDRDENSPLVCAGGPCSYNPEPLADFIDFFMMGEGEEIINEVLDLYKECKNKGLKRQEILISLAGIEGIYVPSLYDVSYNDDNTISEIKPTANGIPNKIKKRIIGDLTNAYFPDKIIVPYMDIVHNRIMLEIFRGCIRGCRFCQAGMIYRPVRERTPEKLFEIAKKLYESSGYEEMSLSSLSTSDYSDLEGLIASLFDLSEQNRINLSLPSLRVDSFSKELMEKVSGQRKSSLTFAPEAGTQRLRDIINKNVTEEDLLKSVKIAFEGFYNSVKLYFMIGLPNEKEEDIDGIVELSYKVVDTYFKIPRENRASGVTVTVSTSSFVPKPFTPFQWEGQNSIQELKQKQDYLKSKIKSRQIKYNWHDTKISHLEAVFARGDRRLCKVLLLAHKKGCKFDGWDEFFKYDAYLEAFDEASVDPSFYATRKRDYSEILPWEHIDVGVSKEFLINENEKAKKGITTKSCREKCSACGANIFEGGVCFE